MKAELISVTNVIKPFAVHFGTFPSDFLNNIRMTCKIRHRMFDGWMSDAVQNTSSSALRVKSSFFSPFLVIG